MKHHFVLGTCGHIDHGKTALTKALTGVDTDRLAEEKRRGITIDLGFAPLPLGDLGSFSLVDVPGHEKYLHNMLAGATCFDAALFVVAADKGLARQSLEHLTLCDQLGVQDGVIVMTKVDLVPDAEVLDLAEAEIREATQGTFLQQAPILRVSTKTGSGLTELKSALQTLLKKLRPHSLDLPPRFAIDRVFLMKGFGVVVSGTLLSGKLSGKFSGEQQQKENDLHLYPLDQPLKIRGLQVHGQAVDTVLPGQRAALNLAHCEVAEFSRGAQISSPQGVAVSSVVNVELSLASSATRSLQHKEQVRIAHFTQDVQARVILFEAEELCPGQRGFAQLKLENPLCARYGDRFAMRSISPLLTLGGGIILEPAPRKSRRLKKQLHERLTILGQADIQERIEQCVYLSALIGITVGQLAVSAGINKKTSFNHLSILEKQRQVLCLQREQGKFIHQEHLASIGNFVQKTLNAYHLKFPERNGMPVSEMLSKLAPLFTQEQEALAIIADMLQKKLLRKHDIQLALPLFRPNLALRLQDRLQQCMQAISAAGFQVPGKVNLWEQLQISATEGQATINFALHHKQLVQVSEDLYYTPEQLGRIKSLLLDHFKQHAKITVIDFKNILAVGRKHAVALLEYFDSQRITVRNTEWRVLFNPVDK